MKSAAAREAKRIPGQASRDLWHRGYCEHIISSESGLNQIRRYIAENPANWSTDEENPSVSIVLQRSSVRCLPGAGCHCAVCLAGPGHLYAAMACIARFSCLDLGGGLVHNAGVQSRNSNTSESGAFTLVELLVVISIIAVLLAVLLPSLRNARGLGQRVICKSRLKSIGTSVLVYSQQHDGLMPRGDINERWKSEYWTLAQRHNLSQPTQYYGLGCLWKAGLVSDGRLFYCLAVRGWLDEYKNYCDPTPWGTLPQNYNITTYPTHMQHVRAYKGYLFWPQTRQLVTAAELATFPVTFSRYTAGYPASPYTHDDMSPGRAMALDCSPHTIKGSGFNANVLFGDGHVAQNLWARDDATGRYYFPAPLDNYGCDVIPNLDPPYNSVSLWWNVIGVCQYAAKYQP